VIWKIYLEGPKQWEAWNKASAWQSNLGLEGLKISAFAENPAVSEKRTKEYNN
jgi:hypothetical protein